MSEYTIRRDINGHEGHPATVVSLAGHEAAITIGDDRYYVANNGFKVGQKGYAYFYPAARLYAWTFVPEITSW